MNFCLFNGILSAAIIIFRRSKIWPAGASSNCILPLLICFMIFFFLKTFPYFLAQDTLGYSYTFPAPSLEYTIFCKEPWFPLVVSCIQKPRHENKMCSLLLGFYCSWLLSEKTYRRHTHTCSSFSRVPFSFPLLICNCLPWETWLPLSSKYSSTAWSPCI